MPCVAGFAATGREVGNFPQIGAIGWLELLGIILGYRAAPERESNMAQTATQSSQDPRAVAILAKNIYREFRAGGFSERDVMALAGELLSLVTSDVKNRQHDTAAE